MLVVGGGMNHNIQNGIFNPARRKTLGTVLRSIKKVCQDVAFLLGLKQQKLRPMLN